jgi:hypothetical protein
MRISITFPQYFEGSYHLASICLSHVSLTLILCRPPVFLLMNLVSSFYVWNTKISLEHLIFSFSLFIITLNIPFKSEAIFCLEIF